ADARGTEPNAPNASPHSTREHPTQHGTQETVSCRTKTRRTENHESPGDSITSIAEPDIGSRGTREPRTQRTNEPTNENREPREPRTPNPEPRTPNPAVPPL